MNCPECLTEMTRVYSVEEVEEEFKAEGLNKVAAMKAQFNLLRQMTCPKCGFTKQLTTFEIMAEFAALKKRQGKSDADIIKLMKLKVDEAKEREEDE